MRITELGERIIEYTDITPTTYRKIANDILDKTVCKGRGNVYYGDFMTMDIETSTVNRESNKPIAFTYSIAVYITGRCFLMRTWRDYIDFITNLQITLRLTKNVRLVCYVHNLPYEFQFMRDFVDVSEVFATAKRKIVKFFSSGIEYRCSYKLTNMGLDRFTSNTPNVKHGKLSGEEYDYTKLRTPKTILTSRELDYIYNDVAGLYEALDYMISNDEYDIGTIPLTSTGFVRNDLRRAMKKNPENRVGFLQRRLYQDTYGLLRTARRGGNTHCNPIYSCMELEGITSMDMSSAYPAVMVQCKFPMTKFLPIKYPKDFELYVESYACVIDVTFYNIRVNTLATVPYIPKAHCTQIRNITGDNGRVLYGDRISMVITDIDYEIIRDTYTWDRIECRSCYCAEYDYLPMELRKTILEQYYDKTTLKDKDPYLYMKKKNKFNANFGCMLTDICQDKVVFHPHSKEPYTLEKEDEYDVQLDKYYNSHDSFLEYQHGVWVTAHCRKRLQKAINRLKNDMVYCDTDSAKFFDTTANRQIFDDLNFEIRHEIEECGLDCSVDYKGKRYTLGLWDEDGDYNSFKSMGAKKYCYIDSKGDFSITVAGLSKSKAKDWLLENGGIDAFEEGTTVPKENSGRTTATYNDWCDIRRLKIGDEEIEVGSNMAITDTTYKFSLAEDYSNLLQNIKEGVLF